MKVLQAAAVLCYHRGATAFLLSSSSVSALRRSLSTAHVSPPAAVQQHQRQQQNGLQRQRRAVSTGGSRLRAAAEGEGGEDGLDDEERARQALLKEDFGANVEVDPKRVAVLFDFDGTIGDTETPAMEVAYWELAPYFPEAASKCGGAARHANGYLVLLALCCSYRAPAVYVCVRRFCFHVAQAA